MQIHMKVIKDPVHGYVEVRDDILPLLDSPQVQRLRYVKQLGFSHMVYPGANHTRFEHSVGTMHLASQVCPRMDLSEDETTLVTVAALLHDIGHGPYSHATEPLIEEYTGRSHQEIDNFLRDDEIAGILDDLNITPNELCDVVYGEHYLSGIIHGDLDVDRMDYLLRDAHYTGVPYGTVDAQRLIQSIVMTESGIVLKETGINAAESLLLARTLMRPAVYFHHVSRIAESMVKYAAMKHIEWAGQGCAEALLSMDDAAFTREMLTSPCEESRMMMERLYRRRLYKRALYVGEDLANTGAMQSEVTLEKGREIAVEIAETAGIDPHSVLVDLSSFPSDMSMEVLVRNHHDLVSLENLSPLMKTLNDTRKRQWRMGVYTPHEFRSVVEEAAVEVLHIKRPTKQDKLNI